MSKKNQNSFLILTTLGVYFGLLLVGSSAPQAFAHSATTRIFEISDEIEIKDDLDNNPDADAVVEQFAKSLEDIYRAAADISAADHEGVENQRYDFHFFVTVAPKGRSTFVSKPEFNNGPRTTSGRYTSPLIGLYNVLLPRSEETLEKLRVDFQLTLSDLEFRANVYTDSSEFAQELGDKIGAALTSRRDREHDVKRSLIYSETQVVTDGDCVIVVTRLPRGSLDPLLSRQAK